ncbi:MAG: hypothetical protein L3J04_03715 [Robiginitomaculum sp.]|nr:hypothetical protein [Robiginitomaculum sp.]
MGGNIIVYFSGLIYGVGGPRAQVIMGEANCRLATQTGAKLPVEIIDGRVKTFGSTASPSSSSSEIDAIVQTLLLWLCGTLPYSPA